MSDQTMWERERGAEAIEASRLDARTIEACADIARVREISCTTGVNRAKSEVERSYWAGAQFSAGLISDAIRALGERKR